MVNQALEAAVIPVQTREAVAGAATAVIAEAVHHQMLAIM